MPRFLRLLKYAFLPILLIALWLLFTYTPLLESLRNPLEIRAFILGFGAWAPVVVVLLQAVQTTISIIPSQLTTIAAGFLFGPLWGLVLSLIGASIGSTLVFLLSKKYGRRLALHYFEKKDVVHFQLLFQRHSDAAVFLARSAPLFPHDVVSFSAALLGMSYKKFMLISTLGFLVQMVLLTYFGAELSAGAVSVPVLVMAFVAALLLLGLLFREKLKALLSREIRLLKERGKEWEERFVEREFRRKGFQA